MIEPTETDYLLFGAKRCSACQRSLPACTDFFARNATSPDGLTAACRACRAARERSSNTPEKKARKLAWQREYRARKKGAVAA